MLFLIPVLLATGWLGKKLPQSFVPSEDQGYFYANLQLPKRRRCKEPRPLVKRSRISSGIPLESNT